MARLVVITGPSGVGKGTLIRRLLTEVAGLALSVSATTRPPREGEIDGVSYRFMTVDEFSRRRDRGEFLESAEYAGHLYGTLRSEVEDRPDGIRGVVLEIEVLGAEQIREQDAEAILIFIAPPDPESLRERLLGRGTDAGEQIDLRLAQATREMQAMDRFDTVIVNDDLETAASQLAREVSGRLDS